MKPLPSPSSRLWLVAAVLTCLAGPTVGADDPKPTREAFLAEVLDAKPTAVTPKFDDDTRGSYHVNKEELLKD